MITPNPTVSEEKGLTKSVFAFLSGTLLSRISGFLRDISMAYFFGADASIAAFLVALRFAILFRRIFGEGALLNGFVPYFEGQRKIAPVEAAKFFRDTFSSLLLSLCVIIGSISVGLCIWLPGASISPETKEVLQLTLLILPGVIFICLFGICSGLLHCEKHFFLAGAAPIAYNGIWILSVWILGRKDPATAAIGLSIAMTVAFFCQWMIAFPKTISFLRRYLKGPELLQCRMFSPEIRKMLSSLSLGVLGVTAAQFNTAIDSIFARIASLEGPVYLNYAIHLQQLPLALFGVSIASALLPSLTRAFQSEDPNRARTLLEFSISNAMLLILPSAAAIFSLGAASVNLIYGHGDFDPIATKYTTQCLWGYGAGLVPMVLILLLSPAFYAKKDYWTPTVCSLLSIGLNLLINSLFICVLRWGPQSLAFSTSLSSLFNAWLLYRQLGSKTGIYFSLSFFHSIAKTAVCAVCAGVGALWVGFTWISDPTLGLWGIEKTLVWKRQFTAQLGDFLVLFCVFSLVFLLLATTLKRKEFSLLLQRKKTQIDLD